MNVFNIVQDITAKIEAHSALLNEFIPFLNQLAQKHNLAPELQNALCFLLSVHASGTSKAGVAPAAPESIVAPEAVPAAEEAPAAPSQPE